MTTAVPQSGDRCGSHHVCRRLGRRAVPPIEIRRSVTHAVRRRAPAARRRGLCDRRRVSSSLNESDSESRWTPRHAETCGGGGGETAAFRDGGGVWGCYWGNVSRLAVVWGATDGMEHVRPPGTAIRAQFRDLGSCSWFRMTGPSYCCQFFFLREKILRLFSLLLPNSGFMI